ncbi:hypothetical protein ALC53_08148 [Atta colombica]|uniref:Uncharacterized protein n=1 Tax=Atta colombica TaxID=520822 RepID=A0A195BAY3_9HYME|nr:hypothetical protein ALC53_08148 [Atta colombica]
MRVPPPSTRCLPSPMTSKIGQGAGGLCYKARREGSREAEEERKGRRRRGGPLNCPSMSSVSISPLYLSVSLFLPPSSSLAAVTRQDRRRLTGGLAMREEKDTLELRPHQLFFTSLSYHLASRTCMLACTRTRRSSALQIFGTALFWCVSTEAIDKYNFGIKVAIIICKYKQNQATRALAVELSYFQFGGRDPFAL